MNIFKPIIFFICLSLPARSISQVNFENISFATALEKSAQTGKLIFLQFESDECDQCNEVANKGFEDKTLAKQLEQSFICIKIGPGHPDRNTVAYRYDKVGGFGSLFINRDGALIHNYPGSTSYVKIYQEHIDKALIKAGEGLRVSELETQYHSGNKSPALMELLMETKKTLGLQTDSLLEEYVRLLPADSFASKRTIQFIATMAPVLGTEPYNKMRQQKLFVDAWREMPQAARVSSNRRIIYKSLHKAIREKDRVFAARVAAMTKSTYGTNIEGGQRAADSQLLEFYLETGDTLTYFDRAILYYDKYFMTIPVDSIIKTDSLRLQKLFESQKPPEGVKSGTIVQGVSFAPSTQYYNRELNKAAFNFSKLTANPVYLEKALAWSRKANDFFAHYISMRTNAVLFYKTGKKAEAETWMIKAIEDKKKKGFDTKSLEKDLEDMKKGKFNQQ